MNTWKNEENMRSHGNTAHHPPVGPSLPETRTILAEGMLSAQRRLIQVDQVSSAPRLREIQQASKLLARTSELRETRILALRRDIERGDYHVEVEQVAEKIMKDLLLELFRY
jgi:anti-sigma28 factor (negative regulator of flagellin synthesis)